MRKKRHQYVQCENLVWYNMNNTPVNSLVRIVVTNWIYAENHSASWMHCEVLLWINVNIWEKNEFQRIVNRIGISVDSWIANSKHRCISFFLLLESLRTLHWIPFSIEFFFSYPFIVVYPTFLLMPLSLPPFFTLLWVLKSFIVIK